METILEAKPFYASIWRRLGALILDFFILGVIGFIAGHILPFIGSLVVWFFYAPILESSGLRATLGKHLMGIQVVDVMGRRISFKASLIRNLMKIVSTAISCLGFVIALFTQRKQALHDLIAETVVVYGRSERAIADAWTDEVKELFRAGQGGMTSSAGTSSATDSFSSSGSVIEQLERLQALRDRGVLTQDEFETAKAKILRS